MNTTRTRRIVIVAALVGATSTGAALATTASAAPANNVAPRTAPAARVLTPNDCIRINEGDFNACNVGNSGRGDLPYSSAGARAR